MWLETLAMHISVGHKLPTELIFDIEHYKGTQSRSSSISSTPDGQHATRPKTPTNSDTTTDVCCPSTSPKHSAPEPLHIRHAAAEDNNNAVTATSSTPDRTVPTTPDDAPLDAKLASFIRDIPKSPHLSKDFSPTGERIRDSVRARRRQRMQQQREQHRKSDAPDDLAGTPTNPTTVMAGEECAGRSETAPTEQVLRAVKDTLEQRRTQLNQLPEPERPAAKVRPYGTKGFIINMGNEGGLTLNNVRDLEGCSDFDSSCDTSLNYVDVNCGPQPQLLPLPHLCQAVETALESPLADQCVDLLLLRPFAAGEPRAVVRVIDESVVRTTPSRFGSLLGSSTPRANGNGTAAPHSLPHYRQLSDSDADRQPATTSPVGTKRTLAQQTADSGTPKAYKTALDELKSKFNMCRTKLESLESNSRRSMRNYFRSQPAAVHAPRTAPSSSSSSRPPCSAKAPDSPDGADATTVRHFMYSRINPLLSPGTERRVFSELSTRSRSPALQSSPPAPLSTPAAHQRFGTRLFRIGETPIFERRHVRSMLGGSLFRRSDSDENIPAKSCYKVRGATASNADAAPVHGTRPTSATATVGSKQRISPTADLRAAYSFAAASPTKPLDQPAQRSAATAASPPKKTLIVTSKPNTPLVFTTTRPQQTPTATSTPARSGQLRSQVRSADRQQQQNSHHVRSGATSSASSSRVSLLSPERIYRLNAKLTENKQTAAAASNNNHNNSTSASRSPVHSMVMGAGGPARALSPNGKEAVAAAATAAAANNNRQHPAQPQLRSATHLRPTGRSTATQVHASPAAVRRNEAANQYQKSMLVHKFADSPVRRTVGKFDATATAVAATAAATTTPLPAIGKVGTSGNCR